MRSNIALRRIRSCLVRWHSRDRRPLHSLSTVTLHFTNVVALRALTMRETWRRVGRNYPGAELRED